MNDMENWSNKNEENKRPSMEEELKYVQEILSKPRERTKEDCLEVRWDQLSNKFFSIFYKKNFGIDFSDKFKVVAEHNYLNYYNDKGELVFDGVHAEETRNKKQEKNERYQEFLVKEKEWLENDVGRLTENEIVFIVSYHHQEFNSYVNEKIGGKLTVEQKQDGVVGVRDHSFTYSKRIYDNKFNLIYDGTDPEKFLKKQNPIVAPRRLPRDAEDFSDAELQEDLQKALKDEDYKEADLAQDELRMRKLVKPYVK